MVRIGKDGYDLIGSTQGYRGIEMHTVAAAESSLSTPEWIL